MDQRGKIEKLIGINGDKKRIYSVYINSIAVGFIVIHFDGSDFPFISYAIRRSFQGKGIATKALNELLKIERNNFIGFKAATHLENEASQNLLVKCNFTKL